MSFFHYSSPFFRCPFLILLSLLCFHGGAASRCISFLLVSDCKRFSSIHLISTPCPSAVCWSLHFHVSLHPSQMGVPISLSTGYLFPVYFTYNFSFGVLHSFMSDLFPRWSWGCVGRISIGWPTSVLSGHCHTSYICRYSCTRCFSSWLSLFLSTSDSFLLSKLSTTPHSVSWGILCLCVVFPTHTFTGIFEPTFNSFDFS